MNFASISLFGVASLTAGVLLIALAIGWLLKPKAPKRAAGGATAQPPLLLRWLQGLARQLARLMAGVRTLAQRREWRYRAPWIVLLGPTGSGRSSLAASGGASRRETLSPQEAALALPGTQFVYYEQGLLIDLELEVAPDSQDPETRLAWNRVVAGLFDRRPERPLDGVILALPAPLLLGGSPAELRRWAERQYGQLLELQRRFEFTFPVYVVVTQCDAVEGFGPFWSRMDPAHLKQMFGWSNPYSLDATFLPDWVDEACVQVGQGLKRLQLQAAGREGGDPVEVDRFFLFPSRMAALRAPLRQVLEGLFRGSAFHSNFFMRGLYFTGAVAGSGVLEGDPRSDVAFVPELLENKVFAETNLARATRQGILSRHTAIRRIQLGTVALFALLCTWLAFDANRLVGQVDRTLGALDMVKDHKIGAPHSHGACVGRETSYALQDRIAQIDAHMSYPTIPVSWFDPRHEDTVSSRLSYEALRQVIFPELRCQLEARARNLLLDATPPDPKLSAPVVAQGWQQLILNRATALTEFERFNKLYWTVAYDYSASDPAPLLEMYKALSLYLYDEPLPSSVNNPDGLFRKALMEVEDKTPVQTPQGMHDTASQSLLTWGVQSQQGLFAQLDRGAEDLTQMRHAKGDNPATLADFSAWMGWIESSWLGSDAQHNPCLDIAQGMAPALKSLKGFDYPAATLDDVAALFGNDRCFQPAMTRLAAIPGPANAPLFSLRDGQWRLAEGAARERDQLVAASGLNFMQRNTADQMVCRVPLQGWDEGKLRAAMAALREYDAFAVAAADPDAPPTLGERLAKRRLAGVTNELLTQAQIGADLAWQTEVAVSPLAALEGAVRQQGGDFGRIKGDLVMLIAMLGQHGLETQAAQLTQCARDFAGDTLANIEALARASHLYRVPFHPVGTADPPETLLANLGSPPQVQELLDRQLQRAQVLGGYAAPFVNFLLNSQQIDDTHLGNRETAAYWGNTITELNRFVQFKEPSGQVAHLDDWIAKQLQPMTLGGCAADLKNHTSPPFGNDLFSLHRATLERQTASLCKARKEAVLDAGYQALAHAFNQSLAGRFPFGDDPSRPAPLLATRQFFLDYAQQRQGLLDEVKTTQGERWRQAERFLHRLDKAAAFFAANLAATPGSQSVGLHPTFRAFEDGTPAWHVSDQLLDWRLHSGQESATFPNDVRNLNWGFGQPVSLDFNWADRSSILPKKDPAQPSLSVDGPHATFFVDGPWALLRLIAEHRPTSRPPVDPLDPTTLALVFEVPVELPEGDNGAKVGRMFLALQLLGTDPTSGQPAPLTLPDFPIRAPLAW